MLTNYIPKDSVIHGLNPLVKLAWGVLIIIMSFSIWDLKSLILLSVIGLSISFLTKLFTPLLKTLITIMLPLLFMLLVFHAILNPAATQEIGKIWFLSVKIDGLIIGLKYFFRLLGFIIISYIFIFTTHPADLINALLKIGMPREFGYVTLATIQFIPLMVEDAKKIMDAQQARGLETKTSLVKRLRAYIPLMTPLILSSIENAYERTISLEVRSFFSDIKRTSFRRFIWKKTDTLWLIGVTALIIASVII